MVHPIEHRAMIILLTSPAIGVGRRLTFRMHPGFKCIKSLQQRHITMQPNYVQISLHNYVTRKKVTRVLKKQNVNKRYY